MFTWEIIKRYFLKPYAWLLLAFLFVSTFVIQKISYLSADPQGEKDCPSLDPKAADAGSLQVSFEDVGPYSTLPWKQKGGLINDASCLNKTAVYGVVDIRSEEDIRQALMFARDRGLKVAMAGVRHSMGGHAFYKNAVVLDMKGYNKKSLNESEKVLTVQSGATWHDIQNYLHPKFAIKAMQSTDIFTVGGSISVNAHGMDHNVGALGKTIRSMRIMKSDGSIALVSREENADLFSLVLGGYGLFGVILDVDLDVAENEVYETERAIIDYADFNNIFDNKIKDSGEYGLMYGHLATAPGVFLKDMILYTYKKVSGEGYEIGPLEEVGSTKLRRFVLNFSKTGDFAKRLKWYAEKNIEPRMETCTVKSRNQAMGEGEACLVSRNDPMHDSVRYLQNNLKNDTDILHEYFIPRERFVEYVDGMRKILEENKANVLNASVRVVHKEEAFLNYAPEEMYSIVLYLNQSTDAEGNAHMKKVTEELIELTLQVNGRFFLPYQLHYSSEQLERSYPEVREFFALKNTYDPDGLFTNTFYERYGKI